MKKVISKFMIVLTVIVSISGYPVVSYSDNHPNVIEFSNLCRNYSSEYENSMGLPINLLRAISLTESGRWFDSMGKSVTWPWTINVKGQGYYYDNKAETIAAIKEFQKKGIKSIDVGCMQINLKYHPEAFDSLEEALDPKYNVQYAAEFISKNKERTGYWMLAIGNYHSRHTSRNRPYIKKVYDNWNTINGNI